MGKFINALAVSMRPINGGLIESRKRRECVAFHVLGTQTWLASEISIGRTRTIASMNRQRLSTELTRSRS